MNYNMFDEIDYFTNFKGNSNEINKFNMNNNLDLFNPYEGYIKGNLFKNLYNQYKNYKQPRIVVKNEKEEMLVNIGQMSFAAHELNLYLDNFPNDQKALDLFKRYSDMCLKLTNEYEKKFGPLNVSGSSDKVPFNWVNKKWPWEELDV